jgi:hypothetical protein
MVRRKIYLDVCCLCRPFDDQTVHRIRMETEAVTEILKRCMSDWELVGSEAIESEISRISDNERMENAESLLQFAQSRVVMMKSLKRSLGGITGSVWNRLILFTLPVRNLRVQFS